MSKAGGRVRKDRTFLIKLTMQSGVHEDMVMDYIESVVSTLSSAPLYDPDSVVVKRKSKKYSDMGSES